MTATHHTIHVHVSVYCIYSHFNSFHCSDRRYTVLHLYSCMVTINGNYCMFICTYSSQYQIHMPLIEGKLAVNMILICISCLTCGYTCSTMVCTACIMLLRDALSTTLCVCVCVRTQMHYITIYSPSLRGLHPFTVRPRSTSTTTRLSLIFFPSAYLYAAAPKQ